MASVLLLKPRRVADERGWFSETYSRRALAGLGIADEFVQDNQSLSRAAGTLRGLHFQVSPRVQGKLVRCTAGRIRDYAVDIRRGSPHFGRWFGLELSEANCRQLWIPAGFAHGFLALEDGTEFLYKTTDVYAKDCERSLRWDDPRIAIDWPALPGPPLLAAKDASAPLLAEQPDLF